MGMTKGCWACMACGSTVTCSGAWDNMLGVHCMWELHDMLGGAWHVGASWYVGGRMACGSFVICWACNGMQWDAWCMACGACKTWRVCRAAGAHLQIVWPHWERQEQESIDVGLGGNSLHVSHGSNCKRYIDAHKIHIWEPGKAQQLSSCPKRRNHIIHFMAWGKGKRC